MKKNIYIYIYIYIHIYIHTHIKLNHFAVHQKLTQHFKTTIPQLNFLKSIRFKASIVLTLFLSSGPINFVVMLVI